MRRKSRCVFVMAALAGAVLAAALPARAQTIGALQQAPGNANVADTADAAFLTAGIAQSSRTPPPGGSGAQGFGIGAKIGPMWTSFDAANNANLKFDTSNGWEGGIWFGGNRGGTVGVMGEILYAKKKQSIAGFTGTTLQYLEIPILMRLNIGSRSRSGVSIYGLVGPVFDINLKAKQGNLDVKDNYESLDFGVLFGGGIEITRILIEGRYNKGLRNLLKGGGGNINEIKTQSFALLFGVRFN
jgi:outer membrane protein with beta-barrel domain